MISNFDIVSWFKDNNNREKLHVVGNEMISYETAIKIDVIIY